MRTLVSLAVVSVPKSPTYLRVLLLLPTPGFEGRVRCKGPFSEISVRLEQSCFSSTSLLTFLQLEDLYIPFNRRSSPSTIIILNLLLWQKCMIWILCHLGFWYSNINFKYLKIRLLHLKNIFFPKYCIILKLLFHHEFQRAIWNS